MHSNALGALQLDAGVNVNFFSYLDFFGRLSADPTQFGLPADLNFTTTCQAAGAGPGCEGYFYFATVHPTAAIHRAAFGDIQRQFGFAAAGAIPEPGTWALMIVGFGFAGAAMRRRQRQAVRVAYA